MASSTQDIDIEREPAAASAESESGLDQNVAGALSYLFGFVSGLIFFLIEKNDEFVRWHAAQSMAFAGVLIVGYIGLSVVGIVISALTFSGSTAGFLLGGILSLVMLLVWLVFALGGFAAWIYLMVKAYQGKTPRMPIAAKIADKLV